MPPSPSDRLLAFLGGLGLETTTVDHPPLHTVEESRALRGAIAGGHTKNLFLKDKKGRLFLVSAPEDATVDLKRLHEKIGASGRLSFASADALREHLGLEPGSVTPFGVFNDAGRRVTVVLDAALLAHARLNFHPLVNTRTTTVGRDGLLAFLRETGHEPLIVPVSEPAALAGAIASEATGPI
jgi:Ala-tRNA(Pro) deacylase